MNNLEILLSRDDIPEDTKEIISQAISKQNVLGESEERFRLIAETSLDIIFQTNKDSVITYCSPAVERVLGYTPEEIIGTQFSKIILSDDLPKAREKFQQAITGKTIRLVRRQIKHKNGEMIIVEINGSPLIKEGKIIGTQGIVRDITERIKVEKALRESERKYRTLVERANDGIAILQDAKLIFLNKQVAEMLGYNVEEMFDTFFKDYIHPDDFPLTLNRYQARMAGQDVPSIYEIRLVKKDGTPIDAEINAGVITYQNKPANLAIVRDITERKQIVKAIKESEEKFRILAEQSPNMIFINKRSLVVYANKKSEETLGYNRKEFYSSDFNFLQLIALEYQEKLTQNFKKHLAGEEVEPVEYDLIKKDGHRINVILTTKLIDYEGDKAILGIVTDISKQKQAEKELRLSDEILKQMPAGILLVDQEELKIQRWMGKAEQIFGFSGDEAIGKPVDFIHHPEVRGPTQSEISRQITETGEFFGEVPCIRKNGSKIPIELTAKTVYDTDGTALATIGINIDISERKKAERILLQSEERYRSLFEDSPISLWEEDYSDVKKYMDSLKQRGIKDLESYLDNNPDEVKKIANMVKINDVNNVTLTIYEAKSKEKFFEGLGAFFSEEAYKVFKEEVLVLHSGQTVFESEYPGFKLTGEPIHVVVKSSVVPGFEETLEKVIVSIVDVTKLKQVEKELRESEQQFRNLVETSPDGIAQTDLQGNIVMLNKQCAIMLGYEDEEELIGTSGFDLIDQEQKEFAVVNLKQIIESGRPRNREYVIFKKDGTRLPVETNTVVVQDENGFPTYLMSTLRDVSERKKAEEVKKELEERRDNFVWMTSHELRTPLTVVTGYCDLLEENIDLLDQKQRDNMFKVVRRNLDRLERLATQVTMIAQIERGIFEVKKTVFNLCNFLKDTIEPYQQLLGKQFEFQICQEDPLIILEGDTERLKQVFDNILDNAIKHTSKDQRKIKVEYEILNDHIHFQVSDNGAGIVQKDLKRIFDQFVSISTEYSTGGTGIGLYLCQKIVEAHGGKLTAQSKGKSRGATFSFDLPRTRH